MKMIITETYEEMSTVAAQHILGTMYENRRTNIAITAGTSPIRMYEMLIPQVKGKDYFSDTHFYNFDEIPYKHASCPGITISTLNDLFLKPANIPTENIHALDENNYQAFDSMIKQDGGLDLFVMGIGADGHYCGNLPGTTRFQDLTSKVPCDERLKNRIGRLFTDKNEIPDFYVTMGPKSVMQARKLMLIASGKEKAAIIKEAFFGPVTPEIPASILQLHPHLTIIIDKDAASEL